MKKYLINGIETNEDDFLDKLNDEIEKYVDKNYDEILDERFGSINIAGCDFNASRILSELDSILYSVYMRDVVNDYYCDYKSQLEHNNNNPLTINDVEFEII